MDTNQDKLLLLIKETGIDSSYFDGGKLNKIVCNTRKDSYRFDIDLINSIPFNVYLEFYEALVKRFSNYKVSVNFSCQNMNMDYFNDYFDYTIDKYIEDSPLLKIYKNINLQYEGNVVKMMVSNKAEIMPFEHMEDKIKKELSRYGYDVSFDVSVDKEKEAALKAEIADSLVVKDFKVEKKDPVVVLGEEIKSKISLIKDLVIEENNVTVEGFVFADPDFHTTKNGFVILTLKITDYSDSIYAKLFIRDNDDSAKLEKSIKKNKWYKLRGYTKNDAFSHELVLNIRDINNMEKEDEVRSDDEVVKRVELHTHTQMSQMDGIVSPKKLVECAKKWGMRGIAITDHNGVQAFPDVFRTVCDMNKGKSDDEKFKALYGTELLMIDDSVAIVKRGDSRPVIGTRYCVFDFETTGFNAAGGDSIIEIGAVIIENGNIIERYDELINPGHKLNPRITEVTSITDDMLKDKDNEENAIKRFIKFFGDMPLVAHNARFDTSFLEMCYRKYNLGTFNNTVIDTLELSRAIDRGYSRHSLSAIVKRYNVPFDEESHHRGDYDAEGTALVLDKMLKKAYDSGFETIESLNNLIEKNEIYKYGEGYRINIIAKNKVGLKNLFKIVSFANTKYLYKSPRILRSEVEKLRDGLLIGAGCYESEVFVKARSKSDEEMINIIDFYDYVEVQPVDAYTHLLESNDFVTKLDLQEHIEKVIKLTKNAGKIAVATGDVHYLNDADKIYRSIIINQKTPGGGRHPLARYREENYPNNHLRTTREMLDDFAFLGDDLCREIVIDNTNKILDMCEIIEVIPDTKGIPFSPRVRGDDGQYLDCPVVVTNLVYDKAHDWYGDPLPYSLEERISKELYGDALFDTIKANLKDSGLDGDDLIKKQFEELHNTILKGKEYCYKVVTDKLNKDLESASDDKKDSIRSKLKKPLGGVIGGGFDPIYLIAQRLVKHSNDDGFLVGSRGSVGSSFVATMMGITEVNPLPPHYRCPKCKLSIFSDGDESLAIKYPDGYDLPDKECPNCHIKMIKDGHDMPFATFLGFNADKVPDIDLNFSDLNQASAHAYTKVLFGEDNVYRAGTVGTVADKTAYGYVKGYFEDKGVVGKHAAEIERLALGITGIKRTTGQHPGGIVVVPDYKEVYDFTPYQFPAEDVNAEWRTTHFDYHSIESCLLKLDILGHSDPTQLRLIQLQSETDITKVPLDDKDTMKIFASPEILGLTPEQIMCNTGTLGIPEFGTPFTIQLVEDTKPTTFAELVKISGLAHGTDVWLNNAQLLVKNNVVPFSQVIGCRDDIMVNLMSWGLPPKLSFDIMEFVRKGRAAKAKKPGDPEQWQEYMKVMREYNIPDWYIDSCGKIQYMFPKAHAAAYVINAYRIAWYKVHMPLYFYASWLSTKATDFDIDSMIKGYDAIKSRLVEIQEKGYDATNKENGIYESLHLALEACARGIKIANIDLNKSDALYFKVDKENNALIPPFKTIDGLGDTVALKIVDEREKGEFLSIEDLQKRGKVSSTLIEKMRIMGILDNLDESSQLSLF